MFHHVKSHKCHGDREISCTKVVCARVLLLSIVGRYYKVELQQCMLAQSIALFINSAMHACMQSSLLVLYNARSTLSYLASNVQEAPGIHKTTAVYVQQNVALTAAVQLSRSHAEIRKHVKSCMQLLCDYPLSLERASAWSAFRSIVSPHESLSRSRPRRSKRRQASTTADRTCSGAEPAVWPRPGLACICCLLLLLFRPPPSQF